MQKSVKVLKETTGGEFVPIFWCKNTKPKQENIVQDYHMVIIILLLMINVEEKRLAQVLQINSRNATFYPITQSVGMLCRGIMR